MNLASGHVLPSPTRRASAAAGGPLERASLSRTHGWLGIVLGALVLALAPATALAHPALDAAIASAEEADFDGALASFDRAIASGELTRDELITLFSERALVLSAVGRDTALSRDLSLLAMLAPDKELGRAAPPHLVARWNELRASQGAPLTVHGTCATSSSGTQLSAQVEGLRNPELGQVFIHVRGGDGLWVQRQAAHVDMSAEDVAEYYVEVRGLGGIPLAMDGNPEAPLECASLPAGSALAGATTGNDTGKSRKKMWWWIGGTGAVVALAAAATIVIFKTQGDDEDRTVVGKPMVSF